MPKINIPGPVLTALKWLLAAEAIWLAARKVSLPGILPALAQARWWVLGLCIFLHGTVSILNAYRWKILIRAEHLGLGKFLYFIFVGHFFNLFMPSSVASEAIKVYAFGRKYGNLQQNVGITLVGRFMGMLAQFAVGAGALALYYRELKERDVFSRSPVVSVWIWILIAAATTAGISGLYAYRQMLARQPWIKAMMDVFRDGTLVAKTAAVTVAIQVLSALTGYTLYLCVFPQAPLGKIVLFILIIQMILMLPFSLGGVGVREYLVILFFSDLGGMPPDASIAANLLGYVPLVLFAAIGGAWILFRKLNAKKLPTQDA